MPFQKVVSCSSGKAEKTFSESAFLFSDPVCLSDFYLLFLSEKEIEKIKEYVPQALAGVQSLVIAVNGSGVSQLHLWG